MVDEPNNEKNGNDPSDEIGQLTGKLAKKIWDTAHQGLRGVFQPGKIKGVATTIAEVRYALKVMAAQANVDAKAIEDGRMRYVDGRLVDVTPGSKTQDLPALIETPDDGKINSPATKEVIGFLTTDTLLRNFHRLVNLEKIVSMAEEEAASSDDAGVSDDPVDELWFARWRAGAEDISHEHLQRLWAKILAGEVKQPGTYSMRTIQFMSAMSRDEAKLIEKIAPFIVHNFVARTELKEIDGLGISELLKLEDLGILTGVHGMLSTTITLYPFENRFIWVHEFRNNKALLFEAKEQKNLSFSCYVVTHVGLELISLGEFSQNIEYLKEIGKFAADSGILAKIGDIVVINSLRKSLANVIELNDVKLDQ